jgi:hypothetical protein
MNGASTVEFLLQLRSLNVTLSADGDRLCCRAPTGVMIPDPHNELAAGRVDLLSFLKGTSVASRLQRPTIALNASRTVEMAWGTAHYLR